MWFGDKGLGLKARVADVIHYCQLGVRRAKPACCRGCKSPTGKESSESILASSLGGGIARCCLKRRQRHWWGRAIELRKGSRTGCRLAPKCRKATRQPR